MLIRRDKYPKPVSDLDIFKDYVLCTAKNCSLRSHIPKLYVDIKSSYLKITAAMKKLLYFWVDVSHKRATNSTGKHANWINCLLNILQVLLNLHNFPLLNINCTEPYLGPLYGSDIIVQILNCKIPERVLLNGAICKRFSKVSCPWRCAACHLLQVFTFIYIFNRPPVTCHPPPVEKSCRPVDVCEPCTNEVTKVWWMAESDDRYFFKDVS